MSPAAKPGPPIRGLSTINWRSSPPLSRPAHKRPQRAPALLSRFSGRTYFRDELLTAVGRALVPGKGEPKDEGGGCHPVRVALVDRGPGGAQTGARKGRAPRPGPRRDRQPK